MSTIDTILDVYITISACSTELKINVIPLPFTMTRKVKKPPVKLNFRQSQ